MLHENVFEGNRVLLEVRMVGMKMILGLACSHRKNGNSYLLLKEALKDLSTRVKIIQLAEMKVENCTACGLCKDTLKCILKDDLESIFSAMRKADAIFVSSPRYLPIPSKLLALIERVGALAYHYPREIEPEFQSPLDGKPFGLIVVSARGGRQAEEYLKDLAFYFIHYWQMRLITSDSYPYIGVSAEAEEIGEVLKNKKAIEQTKHLAKKLTKVRV